MTDTKDVEDDEYIAKLLAEDARQSSIRYSTMGMSALLPKRPTNAAPKPNTRFLKSLVQEAHTHNAALKKKEELEARIRLRKVKEAENSERHGRGHGDERERKRRRPFTDDEDSKHSSKRHRRRTSSDRSRSRDRDERRRQRRQRRSSDESHLRKSEHHNSSHRVRSRDEREGNEKSHFRDHRRPLESDSESSSPKMPGRRDPAIKNNFKKHDPEYQRRRHAGHPSPSPSLDDTASISRRQRSPHRRQRRNRSRSRNRKTNRSRSRSRSPSSSSDPLELLVGPLPHSSPKSAPPLRSRGRGAHKPVAFSSNIDAHFSSTYRPSLDVQPDRSDSDANEDWDMALEALRDRQAWKLKHAERLREAGFADDEIRKWETCGTEKDVTDVKWSQVGQAREWDLGKPILPTPDKATIDKEGLSEGKWKRPSVKAKDVKDGWKRKDSGFLKGLKSALG